MPIDTLVTFFAGYAISDALDRLVKRVNGEAKREKVGEKNIRIINSKVESIHENTDTILSSMNTVQQNLQEILEILKNQYYDDYFEALQLLTDASLLVRKGKSAIPDYEQYLLSAIAAFARCATRRYAVGLIKAKALADKAICHNILNQRPNAREALSAARRIASEAAKENNEVYIRVETQEIIDKQGPGKSIIRGTISTKVWIPEMTDGALALIDEIDHVFDLWVSQS